MLNKQLIGLMTTFTFTLLLCGCGTHLLDDVGLRDETKYPATYPVDHPPPPKSHGTIYQAGHEISLYQDHIAGRVGDILTVRLEEATQGEKKAKTKLNKISSDSFTLPGVNKVGITGHIGAFDSSQQFNGDGEANQQNKLRGTVSVTVTRVLSNGNLVIQGESWLTLNQGREYIRLTGIVRREDIDANNSVSSQRITDARIAYSGSGSIPNANQGGIFTQLLFKFFPY